MPLDNSTVWGLGLQCHFWSRSLHVAFDDTTSWRPDELTCVCTSQPLYAWPVSARALTEDGCWWPLLQGSWRPDAPWAMLLLPASADLGDLLACGATLALRHRCHSYLVCWETLILRVTLYLGIIPFHPPGTQEVITWSGGLLYLDLWICGSYVKVLPPHSGSTTYMPYDLRRQMWFLFALTSSAKQGELQNLCYWAVTAHVWELWMVLCTVWNTVSAVYITVIKWI